MRMKMPSGSETGSVIAKLLGAIVFFAAVMFLIGVCVADQSGDRDCGAYQDNTCPAPHTTVTADGTGVRPAPPVYQRRANPLP